MNKSQASITFWQMLFVSAVLSALFLPLGLVVLVITILWYTSIKG